MAFSHKRAIKSLLTTIGTLTLIVAIVMTLLFCGHLIGQTGCTILGVLLAFVWIYREAGS